MKRYHKKVYFPEDSKENLETFTEILNGKKWKYTTHTLDNLKCREIDMTSVLLFISQLQLDSRDIFEYYTNDTGDIIKVCYRAVYGQNTDLILVMAQDKTIVTIYSNITGDNHITLKQDLYIRG